MQEQALFTTSEVSTYLKVSNSTIYRLVQSERIPYLKGNGLGLKFPKTAIDEWVDKNTNKSIKLTQIDENKEFMLNLPPISDRIKLEKIGGLSELAKAKIKTRLNYGNGAIYQRKTKKGKIRWYLDFKNAEGKRVQSLAPLATNVEEAALALKEETQKVFDEKYGITRKKEKITFREFSKSFLEDYSMNVKKSWKADKSRIIPLNQFFKDKPLKDITPLDIEKFRKWRLDKGNTKSTINRYVALLKKMLNLAIDEGYMTTNPATKVKLYSEKEFQKERILTEEEEKILLENCMNHLKEMIIIALNTGMRRGEIFNLRWKDIDFNSQTLTVKKSKSGKSREIPLNPRSFHVLQELRKQKNSSSYVFSNPKTEKPYDNVWKSFKTASKKAGVDNLRFHDLRHTFASRLVARGADIGTVRELAGHSSITMTQRYVHSNLEAKKKAVDLLGTKSNENGKKEEDSLRICDTEVKEQKKDSFQIPSNHLFSVN